MSFILVGSDFHFPKHSSKVLEAFVRNAAGMDYVVLNGDVFEDASHGGLLHFVDLIRALREPASAFNGPIFFVVGNHDHEMLRSEAFKEVRRRGEFFVVPQIQIGPFRFEHGDHHEGFYTSDYLPHVEPKTTLVVGHAHRPQLCSAGNRQVLGLPCLARNGVPDAELGFAVCSYREDKRHVSITTGFEDE